MDNEFCDAKLKLKLMEDWKKRVPDADEKAATTISEVDKNKGELGKVVKKRNEFEVK